MSDPKDQQVAGIYRAIALRFYSRYADARDHAEGHGGDLSGYGSRPTQRDADERYAAAVEDMIGETPDSTEAALALVEFAGILAADRFVGTITNEPINDERDAYHCEPWGARTMMTTTRTRLRGGAGRRRQR